MINTEKKIGRKRNPGCTHKNVKKENKPLD